VIYASEHYSTALLEKLVHGSGSLPPNQHYVEITIPNGVTYEVFSEAHVPDWYVESCATSRPYGDRWQQERRSLILIVPSVVARLESNFLINPEHPEFPKVTVGLHKPIWWDKRLFSR
jgi:RES domain-containing protein